MDDNRQPVHRVEDYYPKTSDARDFDDTPDREPEPHYHKEEEHAQPDGGPRMITCPKCGNQVSEEMNFCSLCGYRFPKAQETPYPLNNTRIDGYLVDDISAFVGINQPAYFRKFKKIAEGKISFNWAAAIFSNRWMAFRGMFRIAFLFSVVVNSVSGIISYLILQMFQSLGTQISEDASGRIYLFSMMLTAAIGLIAGLLGDSMYWKHTKRCLDRFQCRDREPVSNQKIARSLQLSGGCKMSYALLIIVFDLSFNQMVTSLLQYLMY